MLPVLIDLKFVKIYTFGVFLVLAFFWSVFLLWKNIRLTSYKEDEVFDGMFLSLGSGLFFGRLLYVIVNFSEFGFNPLKFILINGYPGISLYGGMLGGFIGLYLYLLAKKIKFTDMVDYFMPPALLALAAGKLGSFFSGIEVGAKTTFPLALKYAGFDGFRHLTALYEAVLFFIGTFICYKLLFDVRRQKYTKGFVFYFFCWYVSLVYFLFDPLKSTHLTFITGDSLNHTFSLTILLTFTVYFLYYFRTFITGSVMSIRNLLFMYGHKAYGKIHKPAGKSTGGGEEESPRTD
jgi:phosphatidylglycerol:prolipoprotein diacylglycerol transferase